MIPILVLKTENKVIYNKSNLNCKTFFEEFRSIRLSIQILVWIFGSTYKKGEILKRKWHVNSHFFSSVTQDTHGSTHLHSKWSILCIDHIRHLVCIECVIFWYPIHTCYVWDQAVQQDFFYAVRLVHSLLKYFFKFQLWYWIQIYTTKYSNLLITLILVWIVCSTYRKGEILMQKWHNNNNLMKHFYIAHNTCKQNCMSLCALQNRIQEEWNCALAS